ncbi:MAG: YciI family protein [Hyphomonadaceae bacterium]|nr:YciI family protein [Hyphomonadaceae bacterium]
MTRILPLLAPLALAAGLITAAPAAHAAEFTILIYETDADLAARTDPARATAYWGAYNAFAGKLAQAGVLRGGTALSETEARTVTVRGGDARVEPKARTRHGTRAGGYFVIDVADLDAAVRWAEQAPGVASGAVEVRPHRANPMMPMTPMR